MPIARGAKAAVQQSKPAWLLAAAPFVWDSPYASATQDDDEEFEDDDEEYEEDEEGEDNLRSDMMKTKFQNWSANAESNAQYRKTVNEARKILRTPPPPPPQFPEMPEGFCVDPNKVPPVPPMLPRLRHLAFHDDNKNNSKKLPSSCPQKPSPIAEVAVCPPQHLHITPKMPDLPFCDAPVPPPMLPMPPPCGELGPPPPPPPDPPALLAKIERAPPPLPAPPPMYYDLPPPPSVFEPHSKGKIPPLPCLPNKLGESAMARCSNENNDTLARVSGMPGYEARGSSSNNEAALLPPPPPMLSGNSMSTASYWRDDSQQGMIAAPAQKPKPRRKKKKRNAIAVDPNAIQENAQTATAEEMYTAEDAPKAGPEIQEEQFEVLWSSRGRKSR